MKIFQQLKNYQLTLKQSTDNLIQLKEYQLQKTIASLDALSPLKVMQRGYTLVRREEKMIKSVKSVQKGDIVEIQFYDGFQKAEIK